MFLSFWSDKALQGVLTSLGNGLTSNDHCGM